MFADIGNVNETVFVVIVNGKVIAKFKRYDKAYEYFREVARHTKEEVILTHKVN